MPASPRPLTRRLAAAHEALYPGLARLSRQLDALAQRRPLAPVPPAVAALAAELLIAARPLAPAARRRPPPAGAALALAAELGHALSRLEAFEAAHTGWHPALGCFVWLLPDPLPVRRLRQKTIGLVTSARDARAQDRLRHKLIESIRIRTAESYDEGYADAASGRAHRERSA
jgi:hypothetical protein